MLNETSCAVVVLDSSISLKASPDVLEKSGSWLNLSYSGIEKPTEDDLIAVYSPTPDKPKIDLQTAPVKMFVSACGPSP